MALQPQRGPASLPRELALDGDDERLCVGRHVRRETRHDLALAIEQELFEDGFERASHGFGCWASGQHWQALAQEMLVFCALFQGFCHGLTCPLLN